MNKRGPGPLSDVVRSGPPVSPMSATGQDITGKNNTTPPTPRKRGESGSADRARQGSRRQRDRQALEAETLKLAPEGIDALDVEATAAWAYCCAAMDEAIAASWFDHYVPQVRFLGSLKGCVCVEASHRTAARLRDVFGPALGELLRSETDFRGIHIYDEAPR